MSTEASESSAHVVDLVVVGSGAAALAAAVTAAVLGARVAVLEKTGAIGGTSALSGGEIWIPGSRQAREAGVADSADAVLTYLRSLLGDALDEARTRSFLDAGPSALAWLEQETRLRYALMPLSADYHCDMPGASHGGRSLAVLPFDGRILGDDLPRLRLPLRNALIFGGTSVCTRLDLPHLLSAGRSAASAWHAARLIGRGWLDRLAGHPRGTRLTNGNALVGRLLATLRERGVEVRTGAAVRALLTAGRSVQGVEYVVGDRVHRVQARRGVVLATGGFSASTLRRALHFAHVRSGIEHQPLPPAGSTGDAFMLTEPLGVRPPAAMDRPAAWTPVSMVPVASGEAAPFPHFSDRGRPGIVAVGPDGERFVNESLSYHEFVTGMLERGFGHAWLLADHRALRRHGLGAVRPFPSPIGGHLGSGYLVRGRSWAELAQRIGVAAEALERTIARFNEHAAQGNDPEFGRGRTVFERRYGDASHGPNPALGALRQAPFYAVKVMPGDIGTFLGLPTDGDARVLAVDGEPVAGLYAAGNAAHSLFGGHYPSAGITLGPALTFGWLAARHALGVGPAVLATPNTKDTPSHASTADPVA